MNCLKLNLNQYCPGLERIFSIVASDDMQILYVAGKLKSKNKEKLKSKFKQFFMKKSEPKPHYCPVFVIDCCKSKLIRKSSCAASLSQA